MLIHALIALRAHITQDVVTRLASDDDDDGGGLDADVDDDDTGEDNILDVVRRRAAAAATVNPQDSVGESLSPRAPSYASSSVGNSSRVVRRRR